MSPKLERTQDDAQDRTCLPRTYVHTGTYFMNRICTYMIITVRWILLTYDSVTRCTIPTSHLQRTSSTDECAPVKSEPYDHVRTILWVDAGQEIAILEVMSYVPLRIYFGTVVCSEDEISNLPRTVRYGT